MANCVNKNHEEVKKLASKFNLSPEGTAAIIGAWQDINDPNRFPTEGEFKKELIQEEGDSGVYDENLTFQLLPKEETIIKKDIDNRQLQNIPTDKLSKTLSKKLQEDKGSRNNKLMKEVDDKMKTFLTEAGVEIKNVETIKDSDNNIINAVAKADIFNKTVEVIEDKRKMDTLPEETSHVYVAMLGKDNPLYGRMMDRITRFDIYDRTVAEYKNVPGYTEEKLKEEAVAKLITLEILNQVDTNESDLNKDLFTKWWNKVWDWIKERLGLLKSSEMGPFIQGAKQILEGKVDGLLSLNRIIELNQDSSGLSYYQLSDKDILTRESIIDNLEEAARKESIKKRVTKPGKYYTFNLKNSYVNRISNKVLESIFEGKEVNDIKKDKFKQELIDNLIDNELIKDTEFSTAFKNDDRFFQLTKVQYNEIVDGMKELQGQILKNNARINKLTGKDLKPKIFTNLSVFNKLEDVDDNIDLTVVYPNGSVGIYSYEGVNIIKSSKTGEVIHGLTKGVLNNFQIKLEKNKRIFKEQHSIENFAETRVLPMNLKLNTTSKNNPGIKETSGILHLEIGDAKERKYLTQIPEDEELTEKEGLNEELEKMFILRKKFKHTVKNNPKDQATAIKLRNLDKAIKQIQLERNVIFVYNEVVRIYKKLTASENAIESSPDYLTVTDLNNYYEFAEVFEQFAVNTFEEAEDFQGQNKFKQLSVPVLLGKIKQIAVTKLIESINKGQDFDITSDVVETSLLGKYYNQLSEFGQPVFRRMALVQRENSEVVRRKVNETIGIIEEKHKNLKEWANKNNMTVYQAFKKIYDVEQGKLTPMYKKTYFQELGNARKGKNAYWMNKNTSFDEKAFKENKDSYFALLDKMYDTDEESLKLKEEVKKEYIDTFDIHNSKKALFNPGNYFIKLNDNASYYTEGWKTLLAPQNKPLKEYYDTHNELMESFSEMTGKKLEKGFVAEVRQTSIDKLMQTGPMAFGNLYKALEHTIEVREFDYSRRGDIDPNTKKPRPVIPLFLVDKLREKLSDKEKENIKRDILKEDFIEGSTEYDDELAYRKDREEIKKGRKTKSFDLSRNLVIFAEIAYTNKFATDTENTIIALRNIMKSGKIKTQLIDPTGKKMIDKVKGKFVKAIGIDQSDVEVFDKFANMYWYGLNLQNKDREFKMPFTGKKVSRDKLIQWVMKFNSLKDLALRPVFGAANAVGIFSNAYMLGAEGIKYDNNQLNKAIALLLKKDKKSVIAGKYFEVSSRNLIYEKANDLSASVVSKTVTMDNAFIFYKIFDDFLDNTLLVAMMQNYGFDSDGNIKRLKKLPKGTKSLSQLAEIKNDKFHLPGITDNKENFKQFRHLVRKTATGIKGSIPDDNKSLIGAHIVGKLLMNYRNWIPGLAKTRLKDLVFDHDTQENDVGRFRVVASEIYKSENFKEGLKNVSKLSAEVLLSTPLLARLTGELSPYKKGNINKRAAKMMYDNYIAQNPDKKDKVTLEEFEELRAAKLKGFATELSIILSVVSILALLKKLSPDDDESYIQEFFAANSYLITNRGLLELTFWTNPESVMEILDNPIPSMRTIRDIGKLVTNTFDVVTDLALPEGHPDRAIFSKSQRDRTPFGWRLLGLIPRGKQIAEILDLYD